MIAVPGYLKVALAIFLWSSLGVIIRLAGVPVHLIIFYSNLLSLFILWPIIRRKAGIAYVVEKGKFIRYFPLGAVTLINTFTFLYALKHTTIANALMTHYTAPAFVVILAWLALGEKVSSKAVLAIILASVGLWIMFVHGHSGLPYSASNGFDKDALGVISGLLSGFAYALLIILVRRLSPDETPVVLVFYQNLVMCLLLMPFVRQFPAEAAWSFILVGVLHSTMAPLLYVSGLKTVRAISASILGYLEPVCAIFMGVIVIGERPPSEAMVGGIFIILSGLMVILRNNGPVKADGDKRQEGN